MGVAAGLALAPDLEVAAGGVAHESGPLPRVEPRSPGEIGATPQVQREQRTLTSLHGVRLLAAMMY